MSRTLYIFGAVEEELTPLRSHIPNSISAVLHPVGIGSIAGAIAATAILTSASPNQAQVIFVGSIGSYDRTVALLSLVLAKESVFADPTIATGQSFLPPLTNARLLSNHELTASLQSALPTALLEPIATTPSITRDEKQGELLSRYYGSRFENLELHAIASVCSALQIPWASLSCVTNLTSATGHKQWIENRAAAAKITADALLKVFEQPFNR